MALVLARLVVGLVRAVTSDLQPVGDWALIELTVRDVGSHTPLVGPFSRYGWNHPGPLLFWILAVPYRLLRSSPEALVVAAGLVNGGAIAGVCLLAWRRGRWPLLLLTSLGMAVLLRGLGTGFLVDPWNPYLTMLPFALLLMLVWSITCGEHVWLPLAVFVGAFLAQTHVGYVPVVGALCTWAVIGLWWHRRSVAPDGGHLRWWVVAAVAVGALSFAPVVVEQVTNDPGNLEQVVRHFTTSNLPTAGVSRAGQVVGQHLAPAGIWVTDHEPVDVFVGELIGGSALWILPALAVFGVAVWMAWRRGLTDATRLHVTVAVGLFVGFATISRTTDAMFPYLFQWMRPLALLMWLSILWSAYLMTPASVQGQIVRLGGPVVVAATAVLSLVTVARPTDLLITEGPVDDAVAAVAPATIEAAGEGPVLLSPVGDCYDWVANGVALELERAGIPVRVFEDETHRYGEHRAYDGANAVSTVAVACEDGIDELAADPQFTEVARFSPLSAADQREFLSWVDELKDEARAEGREDLLDHIDSGALALFAAGSGLDPELVERYAERQPVYDERIAVFVGPPVDDP